MNRVIGGGFMDLRQKCKIKATRVIGHGGVRCDLLVEISPLLRFKYSIFSDSKKDCMLIAKECIHEIVKCDSIKVTAERELGVWRLNVTPETKRKFYLVRIF